MAKLWTPPGTYQSIDFYLSLNSPKSSNLSVLISHNEKFPTRGYHATFVSSVTPSSAILTNETVTKVKLSLFIPNYVPANNRVLITLVIQEKPQLSKSKQEILGHKTLNFAIIDKPLNIIDKIPPICETKFFCSTIKNHCKKKDKKSYNCADTWTAEVLVKDNITGLNSVSYASKAKNHDILDGNLEIGTFSNFTAIGK